MNEEEKILMRNAMFNAWNLNPDAGLITTANLAIVNAGYIWTDDHEDFVGDYIMNERWLEEPDNTLF